MRDIVPITPGGDEDGRQVPSLAPGQQLFAAIIDELQALGVVIPRSAIAVAAKHGKAALEDGVDPEAVLVGCVTALRQGKGRFATDYIAEVAVVKAGKHLSRRQYEQMLEAHKTSTSPAASAERDLLSRVLGKKGEA